jgi:hypothetical protein
LGNAVISAVILGGVGVDWVLTSAIFCCASMDALAAAMEARVALMRSSAVSGAGEDELFTTASRALRSDDGSSAHALTAAAYAPSEGE